MSIRSSIRSNIRYSEPPSKKDPTLFNSDIIAEYHEYFLCMMLHSYEIYLDYFHGYEEADILNDDEEFNNALQKCKNIVTHYHTVKVEIWMALFMKPIHGVDGSVLSF